MPLRQLQLLISRTSRPQRPYWVDMREVGLVQCSAMMFQWLGTFMTDHCMQLPPNVPTNPEQCVQKAAAGSLSPQLAGARRTDLPRQLISLVSQY